MSYQVIRVGEAFDPVVVVTPYGAGPSDTEAKFYERKSWAVGDQTPNVFYEISAGSAQMVFSGHADGWGSAAILPQRPFASLEDICAWADEYHRIWVQGRLRNEHKA